MELLTAWTTTDDAEVVLASTGEGSEALSVKVLALHVLVEVHVQGAKPPDRFR